MYVFIITKILLRLDIITTTEIFKILSVKKFNDLYLKTLQIREKKLKFFFLD